MIVTLILTVAFTSKYLQQSHPLLDTLKNLAYPDLHKLWRRSPYPLPRCRYALGQTCGRTIRASKIHSFPSKLIPLSPYNVCFLNLRAEIAELT